MKREIEILLAAVMTAAALSGCGGGAVPAVEMETPATAEETIAVEEIPEAEQVSAEEEGEQTEEKTLPAAAGHLITVGVVNSDPGESAYHSAVDKGMKAVFTEENGYAASFIYRDKSDGQIEAARQFIQDGVDYLLLSAEDADDWNSVLIDAQEAGVGVLLFDRVINVDEDLYEAAIVSDADKEGEDAVKWLKDQGLSEYNIIHIQGAIGSTEQKGRTCALDAQMADGRWKIVARQTAGGSADEAQKIVQSVIDSGEPFNVIYAENDDLAKGAVAALDKANISHGVGGDVIIVSFGCNKWALEQLLAQNWNYDEQCNPFQSSYMDEVIRAIESGGVLAEKVIVMDEKGFDAETITAEDIDIYGI